MIRELQLGAYIAFQVHLLSKFIYHHYLHFFKMTSVPASILAFEMVLGGQARLTSFFTPSFYQRAMRKAPGTLEALYPLPVPTRDSTLHTRSVGAMMVLAGVLTGWPTTRGSLGTLGLNLFLTGAGVYSQRRMRIPYWLPVVNSVLAIVVWGVEYTR